MKMTNLFSLSCASLWYSSNYCVLRIAGESGNIIEMPIPVAGLSKALICVRSLAWIEVWIPKRAWISVSCECCVLSGRGLCEGADHLSRWVLPSVVCLCVSWTPQQWGDWARVCLWHHKKETFAITKITVLSPRQVGYKLSGFANVHWRSKVLPWFTVT